MNIAKKGRKELGDEVKALARREILTRRCARDLSVGEVKQFATRLTCGPRERLSP